MGEGYAPGPGPGGGGLESPVEIIGPSGDIAEVLPRTDGRIALEVADDCTSFQAIHNPGLIPEDDTTVTFAQPVRIVRVINWSTTGRVLVKDGVIADSSDLTATRVGIAPTASVPSTRTLPFVTDSIHLLAGVAAEVTVEGYY